VNGLKRENAREKLQSYGVASELSFLQCLALLFIGLKLVGEITWSWWWVLLPLWGPLAAVGALFAMAGVLYLLAARSDRKWR